MRIIAYLFSIILVVCSFNGISQSRIQLTKNASGNTIIEFINNTDNIFISDGSGVPGNSSSRNIAIGSQALKMNTGGSSNLGIGHRALMSNTNGEENIALGWEALKTNSYSAGNIAIGVKSLQLNVDGYENIGLGNRSLYNSVDGYENIGIGAQALYANIGGYGNVALGDQAGELGSDNINCTFIGWRAGNTSGSSIENSMALGQSAQVSSSNQVRIGNGGVTSIGGVVGWSIVSDARIKKDVREDVPGLNLLLQLRPVSYLLDRNRIKEITKAEDFTVDSLNLYQHYSGFLAQEVALSLANLDFNNSIVEIPQNENELYSIRYTELIASLVKAIQELYVEIQELKTKIVH